MWKSEFYWSVHILFHRTPFRPKAFCIPKEPQRSSPSFTMRRKHKTRFQGFSVSSGPNYSPNHLAFSPPTSLVSSSHQANHLAFSQRSSVPLWTRDPLRASSGRHGVWIRVLFEISRHTHEVKELSSIYINHNGVKVVDGRYQCLNARWDHMN